MIILIVSCTGCVGQISQKNKEQLKNEETSKVKIKKVDSTLLVNNSTQKDTIIYNKYKKGKKDGLWRELDGNNQLISEGYYRNGEENGLMKWYHEKGHLAGEGQMKDGLRDGVWKVYAVEDGKLGAEVIFKEGKEIGIKRIYHENEQLKQENNWNDNKIISKKCWDENGKEIECK